jgi:hypothetical protein
MAADISVSNGILRVEGSDFGDRITVEPVVEYMTSVVQTGLGQTTQFSSPIFKYHAKVTTSAGAVRNGPDGTPLDRTFLQQGISRVEVFAGAGADVVNYTAAIGSKIFGGDGDDSVTSGVGDDSVWGQAGNDVVNLGAGDDYFSGSTGNDEAHGGDGNDTLYGYDGDDDLWGENGDDFASAGDGFDWIGGGAGNDDLRGGDDADSIYGGTGQDVIRGEYGGDNLYGEAGLDTIYGGSGNDYISGGDNNDTLVSVGGGTSDTVTGNDGTDTFWVDSDWSEQVTSGSAEMVQRISGFQDLKVGSTVQHVSRELDGQSLIDPTIDSDATYQDFSGHKLFASGGPTMADPNQEGSDAHDCYLIATMLGMTKYNRDLVRRNMVDLGDGTYAVKYQGFWGAEYIRVDGDLPVSADESLHGATLGVEDSIWVAILEKSWAFRRKNEGTYDSIDNNGSENEVLGALGWGGSSRLTRHPGDFSSATVMFNWLVAELSAGHAVIASSTGNARDQIGNMRENHVFLMDHVKTDANGVQRIVLMDPRDKDRVLELSAADVAFCCDRFTSVDFG